jgi:hypothetical protein
MLDEVRRSTNSGYSIILVALLIVVFIFFFGVPSDSCSSGPTSRKNVASINGEAVYTDDINIIYHRAYGTQRQGSDAEVERRQGLALKNYLLIEMFAERARDAGLRVGNEEFREFMQDPVRNLEYAQTYGRDGTWDGQLYKNYVQNFLRVNINDYEDFKREELLARKYLAMIEMQIAALPQEIDSLDEIRNTKLNLEFVKFPPKKLAEFAPVTDEDLQAFIEAESEDIKKRYDQNIDQYSTKEQYKIRRIYVERVEDEENAKERFETAKTRVDEGEDFAAVAGEINDIFKEQQGLMDFREPQNMDQSVVQALAEAEVGDVEEVTTPDAYMLVKLEDKKEAKVTPFEEVKREIAREMLQQRRVDSLIEQMADRLLEKAQDTETLAAAVGAIKAEEGLTDADDEASDDAAADDGEAAKPTSPWTQVTVDTTGTFTLEGRDMSAMFGGQLPPGVSLGRGAWDRIPKLGTSRALAVDAFKNLSEENPLAEKPYKVGDALAVVRLEERIEADTAAATDGEEAAEEDGEDAEEAADEGTSAEQLKLVEEVRNRKISEMLGNWRMLFARPTKEYGPWIEAQYEQAVESKTIKLHEETSNLVSYAKPGAAAQPANKALGGEGSPIKLSPGGAKGGAEGGSKGGGE